MSVLLSLEGLVSLMSCVPTGSYNLSISISAELAEPLEEKLVEGLPLRTECSEVFYSLPFAHLWVLYYCTAGESFSEDD